MHVCEGARGWKKKAGNVQREQGGRGRGLHTVGDGLGGFVCQEGTRRSRREVHKFYYCS